MGGGKGRGANPASRLNIIPNTQPTIHTDIHTDAPFRVNESEPNLRKIRENLQTQVKQAKSIQKQTPIGPSMTFLL